MAKPYCPPPAIRPQIDRRPCNYCEAPYPKYYVPPKPYPRERLALDVEGAFGDEGAPCDDPGLYQPHSWSSQPEPAGDFGPEMDGYEPLPEGGYDSGSYAPGETSIISDQP